MFLAISQHPTYMLLSALFMCWYLVYFVSGRYAAMFPLSILLLISAFLLLGTLLLSGKEVSPSPVFFGFLGVCSLVLGVFGTLKPKEIPVATTIKRNSVIEQWGTVIAHGAGQEKRVMDDIQTFLKEANMPHVRIARDDCSTGLFSTRRHFFILDHDILREYRMFLGARDYGANLDVSWFLTVNPSGLKRALSRKTTGNPLAFSMQVDIFTQQDLRSWTTIAHHCVKQAIETVCEELQQVPAGLNTSSKGFLSVW